MPPLNRFLLVCAALLVFAGLKSTAFAQRQPEFLSRGVIALRGEDTGGTGSNNWSGTGVNRVYVGWRLFATDPEGISFNVYRSANGAAAVKLNGSTPITNSTNYVDTTATLTVPNTYHVTAVISGVEGAPSASWTLPANAIAEPCFTIPLSVIADGAYYVHLAWAGDLDGDGYMDLVVNRLPETDAALTIKLEAYSTRTRTRLWQVDYGTNGIISDGQNDGVTVFDFDGDGKCEVVTKSIAGTRFGDGTLLPGSGTAIFLSVLDGTTGAERSRFQVAPAKGASIDAKNIGVAFFDGVRPGLVVMDEAHDFNAYNVNPTTMALSLRWKLDSPSSTYPHGHGIRVDDPDGDGKDEISDLGMAVDDNGTLLFQTQLNHGDRYHITDIDPDRPGLECFAVQQDNPTQLSYVLYDALTGNMIWRRYASTMVDNGRGDVASIDSRFNAMQNWSASSGTLIDHKGNPASNIQPTANMSIWWDGDPLREILNRQLVDKWNSSGNAGGTSRLLTGFNFHGANYSWRDAVPLYGDLFGDWREEIVMESGDGTTLIVFSTTKVATSRFYTLLQDPQYRCDLTLKGYMQTHQPSFYFGNNMPRPPRAPVWDGNLTWVGNAGSNVWDTGTARWKNSITGAATAFADGQSVLFDLTGVSSTAVALTGTLNPSQVVVHAPRNQAYTFGGTGSLAGAMTLTKGGQGSLTLSGNHSFTGPTVVSEGALMVTGALSGSAVRVDSRGVFGGTGTVSQAVSFPEVRGVLAPGGVGTAGTLTLGGGLSQTGGTVNTFDLSSSPGGVNDRVAVTGNLTLSGANVLQLNLLNGSLSPGTYTLFTYTGTFTGTLSSIIIRGADAYACTLANTGSSITLTVATLRSAADITWAGGSSGAWTLNGGAGWLRGSVSDGFVTGDTATFNDSGSSTPAVTLSSTVLPAATVVNSTANYTLSGTGSIGGSGGLTKSGTGTLTLSTANTYTGPTTVNGGVLAFTSLAEGGQASAIGASSAAPANLVLNGGALRLTSGSTSTFRGLTLGASGGTLHLPSSSSTLTLSGAITGSGSLVKTGSGLLILNAVNTYSGGTVIEGGTVVLTASSDGVDYSPTSPIQYGLGTGSVTLAGGTLSLSDTSSGDLDGLDSRAFWPIVVPAATSGRLNANGRMNLGSALSGSGTFTFFTPYVRTDVSGDWSPFAGRINVIADTDGGDFRLANAAGLPNAWLDLAAGVYVYSRASAGTTIFNIGSLSGAAGSVLSAGTGSGAGQHYPAHWRIGARGDNTSFAGVIIGTSIVTKVGPGSLTLTGANTYTGATTVSAGKLALQGGSLTSNVAVSAGAGFGGNGTVTGNVNFASGAVLLGNPTAGPLAITGNLTFGGPVTVSPIPGATLAGGTYPLYTYTGTLTGTPAFTWSGPGYNATFSTSGKQVSIILEPLPREPGDIVWTGEQTTAPLTAAWNSSTPNWVWSLGTTFFRTDDRVLFDDTSNVINVTISSSVAPASVTVNSSANYTFSGTGAISGVASLVKSGEGNLTISSAQTFTGGSRINAGTVTLGNATGLGTGPITLAGGTLATGTLEPANALVVAADSRIAGGGGGGGNQGINAVSGAGVLTLEANNGNFDLEGSLTDFTGTLVFAGTGSFRLFGTAGSAAADFDLGTRGVNARSGAAIALGSLTGASGSTLSNNSSNSGNVTYTVGANGRNTTYAGVIQNSGVRLTALTKTGSGVLTLSGANTYTGITNVDTGALYITGSLANTATSVASGATIGGAGALGGSLTLASGARLAFGVGLSGTQGLAVGGTVTLSGTADGNVAVIPIMLGGQLAPGTYTILSYTGSAPALAKFSWSDTTGSGLLGSFSAATGQVLLTLRTPLQTWRQTHFGTSNATGNAANDADPDRDGDSNLFEYATGSDPNVAAAPDGQVGIADSHLQITFNRIADPALTYTVQGSGDLMTWSDLWTSTGAANTAGPVTVSDPVSVSKSEQRFLQLKVTTTSQ